MKIRSLLKSLPFILLTVIMPFTACTRGEKPKILYINSYHQGYPSSDDIMNGIKETLSGTNVALEIVYLDSKLNPDKLGSKAGEVAEKLTSFSPDLVIASDDNALVHVVLPYLNGKEIPVVFCGVNWSAERYALKSNVTGMLEVLPLRECIQTIRDLDPDIRKISVLSENSLSERNNTELLDTLYRNMGFMVQYRLVDEFDQWKEAFKALSLSSDLIYMPTNGAIRNWDSKEALSIVEENLNVPTITCDDFMMEYCVFGLTKVAKEQGEWAAETALEILNGASPSDFPYTRNIQFNTCLNQRLADIIGFRLATPDSGSFTEIN